MSEREEMLELAEWARAVKGLLSLYAPKFERIAEILEDLAAAPAATPPGHVSWTDEDYNKARNCMIGILRRHAWTIADGGRGQKEFDNAFQHAVGILALTAVSGPLRCEGCDQNYADLPSKLCPGCQAYQEHQQ